jgi:hypothetical protein
MGALYEAVLEIIDLENKIAQQNEQHKIVCNELLDNTQIADFNFAIQINEFTNDDDTLCCHVPEKTWIESIKNATGLDVRAILSPLPTEAGFYKLDVAYVVEPLASPLQIKYVTVKTWVVGVNDGEEPNSARCIVP